MDGIKQRPARQGSAAHQRSHTSVPPKNPAKKQRHAGQRYWLVRSIGKVAAKGKQTLWTKYKQSEFARWHKKQLWRRGYTLAVLLLFVVSTVGTIMQPFLEDQPQYISPAARSILPRSNPQFAQLLQLDTKTDAYVYNNNFNGTSSENQAGGNNDPRFSASFSTDATKGITVSDKISSVDMSLKPKFRVAQAKKEDNRILYKLSKHDGVLVYTSRTASVKEDIILESYDKNDITFEFELQLGGNLEARVEQDGSLGVYGIELPLNGNVTTATESDAALLDKVRQNGKKTKRMFSIPAPVVLEANKKQSEAKSRFELNDKTLKVITTNLQQAHFPVSIDPTVYIDSAARLMRGNNETNVDFDVDNELIQKSQTTGARIDSWSSTTNLSNAVYAQGTAVAGGYIYSAGGVGAGTTNTTTYNTAQSTTYNVPAGVNYVTIKMWGGGGSGGNGSGSSGTGGAGGGGGYAKAVIAVTPGENLTVVIGSGGADRGTSSSAGGNGGGFSAILRSGTYLVQAGGGGGGGGALGNSSNDGGAGGAGGGVSGANGTVGENSGSGGGFGGGTTLTGTPSDGGTGGTGGTAGASGVANGGGNGGGSDAATCNDAMEAADTGGNGGFGAGGAGGNDTSSCTNGGGGGGGRFGGGGGGSINNGNRGAGGGGGGSSYINPSGLVSGTDVQTAGSGTAPGNSGDSDRGGLGDGGTGGTSTSGGNGGDNGIVIISYSTAGSVTDAVYWAQFNTSTNAIQSPDPGTGACSGWCTNTVYKLPTALRDLSLVAYNGFLYAMGGANSGGTPQTTVYVAKIGANGEPQLWHPSGGTPDYWYSDTALSNARSQFAAVAYNNRMYILGGLTTSSTVLSSNTVQYADIRPNGTLTSFTSTGMQALSGTGGGNRYGVTAHAYNNTLYVIGGNATFAGTPVTNVDYSRLNSDGTMNSWKQTSAISGSGRLTVGGSYTTIFGGYLYANGGCTTVNASGYCSAIASDVQLASINADGSLAPFSAILNLTNDRFAHTTIAWQGGLYRLGGCRSQDGVTGACTNTVLDVDYGVINQTGEASTVASSQPSGTPPCDGGNPYSCELPGVSIIGNVLNGSAIMNGYLYIWGGCSNTSSGCGTVSSSVAYTSIDSNGLLTKPASCGSWSSVDSYCYNTSSLPGAVGAPGVAVFNGYIYSIGGFTASGAVNQIYYAQPSTLDGSISTWNRTSLTGVGGTSVSYPYAFARANPSAAGTTPGNLYILGGCSSPAGIGCSNYTGNVYKCTLDTAGTPAGCSTSGQLQIGIVPGDTQAGLGAMAGTVYANYIYLMGGLTPNQTDIKTTRYAKIDDSNNIVAVTGSAWVESANLTYFGRRRGAGFGYNGYLYVVGGYDGSTGGGGVLADIEFAKINVSDGSIGAWNVSSVNINERWGLTLTVSNSYAYVIGGCISGSAPTCAAAGQTNSVQTFQVYNNNSGAPVSYAADDLFTTDRLGASSAIYNGYIYLAGGCTGGTDCGSPTDSVQYASIDAYGNIGTWSAGGALPAARAWGDLQVVGGTLYYIGGQNSGGTAQTTVYYTSGISSGNPTWNGSAATNGLPAARTQLSAAVWDDRIYVTGGENSGTVQSTVYISPKLSVGGNITSAWNSTSGSATAFNVARSGHTTVAYANNLYILGGYNGSNYLSDTQFASLGYKTGTIEQSGQTITGSGTAFTSGQVGSVLQYPDGSTATILTRSSNTVITVSASKTVSPGTSYVIMDGSVGSWTYSTSLPAPIRQAGGFAANGYIYLVGGRTGPGECAARTLVAPISANTTIATGNNPTGVGTWYETNARYSGNRYGAAVSYSNGKIYLLGGGCPVYPKVLSVTPSDFGSNSTTHNVNMPATINSGDLLLALFTSDETPTHNTPAGWTQIGTTTNGTSVSTSVWAKSATGSEGPTVNFGTSNTQQAAAQVYRIAAGTWRNSGTLANDVETAAGTAAATQNPNSPSLNPTNWNIEPTLWLAFAGGSRYDYMADQPSFYTAAGYVAGGTNGNGASTASAYRQAEVASEDANTFTMDSSQNSVARPVAIRPNATSFALTGSDRVQVTAVYSQPQVAQYSRMIDTDTDVSPTGWLMNGLDNSIGARWQTKYRSMHDLDTLVNPNEDCGTSATMPAMTTWGQETNFGNTLLGQVNSYTPLNGSGGNISCARYYYFSISIDASQTFGYPEDVNRGPTMSDLSLFFTADPSKRLRHGATFTGGEQQPLDTPCRISGANPPGSQPNCPLP